MINRINNGKKQKIPVSCDWLLSMLMNGQVSVGEVKEQLIMVAEDNTKYGEV